MSFLNFGDLTAKQLCKALWILVFIMYFMRYFSLGIVNYEGASALIKLKYYASAFYSEYIDPLMMLFTIKFCFELIYKFYEKLNAGKPV